MGPVSPLSSMISRADKGRISESEKWDVPDSTISPTKIFPTPDTTIEKSWISRYEIEYVDEMKWDT